MTPSPVTTESGLHLVQTPAKKKVRRSSKKSTEAALARAQKAHTEELAAIRAEASVQADALRAETAQAISEVRSAIPTVVTPVVEEPETYELPKKSVGLPAVGGALLGGFVPLAAHSLVNAPEFKSVDHLLWIVIACLAYSAPTVCGWAGEFTTAGAKHWASHTLGWAKALGFVICLEGILVAAPESCSWLSWIALGMLMGINAVILGVKFSKRKG